MTSHSYDVIAAGAMAPAAPRSGFDLSPFSRDRLPA